MKLFGSVALQWDPLLVMEITSLTTAMAQNVISYNKALISR